MPINRIKQAFDCYITNKQPSKPRMPLKQWENRLFSRFRGFFNVWKLVGICVFFVKLWQQFPTIYLFDLFSEILKIKVGVYLIMDILPKRVAHHGPLSERRDPEPVT